MPHLARCLTLARLSAGRVFHDCRNLRNDHARDHVHHVKLFGKNHSRMIPPLRGEPSSTQGTARRQLRRRIARGLERLLLVVLLLATHYSKLSRARDESPIIPRSRSGLISSTAPGRAAAALAPGPVREQGHRGQKWLRRRKSCEVWRRQAAVARGPHHGIALPRRARGVEGTGCWRLCLCLCWRRLCRINIGRLREGKHLHGGRLAVRALTPPRRRVLTPRSQRSVVRQSTCRSHGSRGSWRGRRLRP
mmetsp:Transcript_20822/g.52487  ORF Transcript_20822/g.52487 Transcript_20822/m.52487 type:complete len:249 (+) Transcript_20822:1947-2693(+)